MNPRLLAMVGAGTLLPLALAIAADKHIEQHKRASGDDDATKDVRQRVKLPAPLLRWELGQMRERIAIVGQLQAALSRGDFGHAAEMAEQKLGLNTILTPRDQEVTKNMPEEMRGLETELRRAASRFAVEAANADALGDGRRAIAALSDVIQRCVDCHTAYRFR